MHKLSIVLNMVSLCLCSTNISACSTQGSSPSKPAARDQAPVLTGTAPYPSKSQARAAVSLAASTGQTPLSQTAQSFLSPAVQPGSSNPEAAGTPQPAEQLPPSPFKEATAPAAPGFPGKGDAKTWMRATKSFNEAIDLSSSNKYKEAVAKYQEAIKIYPFDPNFFANMAFALERGGDPEAGVEACKKALMLQKDFGGAWENLGNCLYDLGKYFDSRNAFNQALNCELKMSKRNELIGVIQQLTSIINRNQAKVH